MYVYASQVQFADFPFHSPRIHSKLLEICPGRSVIVHLFSDGGFGFARSLLSMWDESWKKGETQESGSHVQSTLGSEMVVPGKHQTHHMKFWGPLMDNPQELCQAPIAGLF